MNDFSNYQNQPPLASQLMVVEIITHLLSTTDPQDQSHKITEQLRELTGAKCVILITHYHKDFQHQLMNVCPKRKEKFFKQIELSIFCPKHYPEEFPLFIEDLQHNHLLKVSLLREGFKNLIRVPLIASAETIGSIVLFDIRECDRVNEIKEVFHLIATPIALALKNAITHQMIDQKSKELSEVSNNLENIVYERTKELQVANQSLEIARLSAMNLMQDSIDAQKKAELTAEKLQYEMAERLKAEKDLLISKISYENVINSVEEMIYIQNEKAEFLFVNHSVIKKYGYPEEYFIGKTPEFLSAPGYNDLKLVADVIGKAFHGDPQIFEFWGITKSGNIFPKEVSASAGFFFNRKVVITVARDISERKKSEQEIKTLLNEKEILLKEVHHRVKNNMSTISSLLALQSLNIKDASAKSALEDAKNRVQSMMRLYDQLYRSKGFKEISICEYLSPLIDEMINSFPDRHKVSIHKNIQDIPVEAKILFSLGIMVYEMISNSMKYAFSQKDHGNICIDVSMESSTLMIVISDDGAGIPPEKLSEENSEGFGLKLIKLLALQIDAELRIDNSLGTLFELKLVLE